MTALTSLQVSATPQAVPVAALTAAKERIPLVFRCSGCNTPYQPNPAGPSPVSCDCGLPFVADVSFVA